jgi:glycosyltransferase involved in cell wall biosynthesis
LKEFLLRVEHVRQPKISLLIPFQTDDPQRRRVFRWLLKYWQNELPDAEIVIGHSRSKRPFSKTEALNNAADKATGKVLVILDADAYISGEIIERCADRILEELDNHLWYVPYRKLWRLTKEYTDEIVESDPTDPPRVPDPPPPEIIDGDWQLHTYGHRYGAMLMIFPRQALDVIGCFDERFKGWGGEDVALLRALDTLYGKHKTTKNSIFHLWHPKIGNNFIDRVWKGQTRKQANQKLANAYHRATRRPRAMRLLVDEGCRARQRHGRLAKLIFKPSKKVKGGKKK